MTSRTLYTGDLAKLMYNTFTQNGARTTHIPEAANCGGYYKHEDTYIAYDFTDGTEVFMEEINTESEAIRYALGQTVMIGGEEI